MAVGSVSNQTTSTPAVTQNPNNDNLVNAQKGDKAFDEKGGGRVVGSDFSNDPSKQLHLDEDLFE